MSDHLPASPVPVSAVRFKGLSATYIYADGSSVTLYGNRPYRDNNPGNLRYSGKTGLARAQAVGAIGSTRISRSFQVSLPASRRWMRSSR